MRNYRFEWSLLGNLKDGRPNLGEKVDLEMYRLLLYTLRDVLELRYGAEETDKIFFDAGKTAGAEFYRHYVSPVSSLQEFVATVQKLLKEKSIGILRVEEALPEEGRVILTIDEDLDCAGLPETDYEVCRYDEGFVSALFECFTGEFWTAKEIDCWCTGARTCRFLVERQRPELLVRNQG